MSIEKSQRVNIAKTCSEPGCDSNLTLPLLNNRCIHHSSIAHMVTDELPDDANLMLRYPKGLSVPEAYLYASLLKRVEESNGGAPAWVYNTLLRMIDRANGKETGPVDMKAIFGEG